MKYTIHSLSTLSILILISTIIVSCYKDKIENLNKNQTAEKEVEIKISLLKKGETIISKVSNVNDSSIRNVNIFIYNLSGNLIKSYFFNAESNLVITCSTGYKTIIAIANCDNINYASYSSLDNIEEAISTQMTNSFGEFVFAGKTYYKIEPGKSISIDMERLVSKITVLFDKKDLDPNTTIDIESISLRNVPSGCKFLRPNKPVFSDEINEYGETITESLEPQSHTTATPLFMFENMQGTIGGATVESEKNPGNSAPFCSYLEMKANYTSQYRSGKIKYKFYLGNNLINNFDIHRNVWYQLNVIFRGSAINEISWRIDTTEMVDIFYLIEAVPNPFEGGTVSGEGYYKYGTMPTLTAQPNTNYKFIGWTPPLNAVSSDKLYTANFQYEIPVIHVTDITVSESSVNIDRGISYQLFANILPANATDKSVIWTTSNPNIVTVNQSGKITGINAGTAMITVTTNDGGYSSSCNVNIYKVTRLFFHFERIAKVEFKNMNGGYWQLSEPMTDNVYVMSDGEDGIPGTITYSIDWAYDPSSGFSPPERTSGTKNIIINNSLNTLLESGCAWGSETDFSISYPTIEVHSISPTFTVNPLTRVIVDQNLNNYTYTEKGR